MKKIQRIQRIKIPATRIIDTNFLFAKLAEKPTIKHKKAKPECPDDTGKGC